ncbi:MAG: hypothetical protein FWE50_03900, partial [Alphaproteobacteria bacterium]|nr:hypothetical protein [Alphaproteobacteria bacterium]
KVQLDECGIPTGSAALAEKHEIWGFVVARLASMRVDSCTKEVKACLQSEDRCGENYTQCVGLDTDTIVRMCPFDKLVGCQKVYEGQDIRGQKVYEELANLVQGIFLSIDNNLLTQCQNAADEAMIKVCGGTEECNQLTVDAGVGTRSLEYKICGFTGEGESIAMDYTKCRTDAAQITDSELREGIPFAGFLDGMIFWESVTFGEDAKLNDVAQYMATSGTSLTEAAQERVQSELKQLQQSINNAISLVESDPTIQFCMTGREVQGMKTGLKGNQTRQKVGEKSEEAARFPDLTRQMRMLIATYAVKAARDNYFKRFDELNAKLLEDKTTTAERMAKILEEDALNARRAVAANSCKAMASGSILPMSSQPPKNVFGKVLGVFMTAGGVIAAPFTGGLSLAGTAAGIAALTGAKGGGNGAAAQPSAADLTASQSLNQWNFKQTITTTFEWETLKCTRAIRSQTCKKTRNPLFGDKYCQEWNNETTASKEFQF